MKIAFASDLHLEAADVKLHNTENADLLILAGDILVASSLFAKDEKHYLGDREFSLKKSDAFHTFFQQVCEEFKNVIYILGNHESYYYDITETLSKIKRTFSYLKNLHVLEKETITFDDITFYCATFWTDFNKNDPNVIWGIRRKINDFTLINNGKFLFTPQDAYKEHQDSLSVLNDVLTDTSIKKLVVVTHHCPSSLCIPEEYKGQDYIATSGFVSNLESFIMDNPKIRVWVSGHTHNVLDTLLGKTRLLQNCRGYYPSEELSRNFELKYFEV